tara:strand:+ start:594 stop:3230 length:2637 start_codon:yes stop_codon:yes gene_type:complete
MAANQVTVATPGPAGVAGLTFEGAWTSGDVYQVRDVVRFSDGNLYIVNVQHTASNSNTPLLNTSYWTLFINADDSFQWATKAKHTLIGDSLGNSGYSALHQASKAQDWAVLTTDAVTNDANSGDVGYSAKAWAIGGTEVTSTASRGAAKEWATTTGAKVDGGSGDYSAKEYAIGTTASTGGSAKDWAVYVGGGVRGSTSDHSAKAWAVGGTGVTTTSSKGAAKEWATTTGGAVDTSEYSAKEYAIGTTATSSKTYATKVDGAVTGTDFSAKAWAIGGTNVTTTASRGAAKEWATTTGGAVDTSEYSSKEYAIGTTATSSKTYAIKVDGAVTGTDYSSKAWAIGGTGVTDTSSRGAAKEWAIETSGTVDGTSYSSKEYAAGSQSSTGGSAKNWATQTGADVTGASSGDMSAKEWAVGTLGRGVASEGSSKDWATYTAGTVDNSGYSSLYHANAASASATAAKNSAAAVAQVYDAFDDKYLGSMPDANVFTASSSSGLLITDNTHGLSDGNIIQVANSGGALPGNLSASTNYHVRDKTTNTFKLATSAGGSAIAYSSAGSGTNTWHYGSPTTTGTWAINSSSITVASATGIRVGQKVAGTGVPTSPVPNVISIDGTTIVISDNMVAAGSGVSLTFSSLGINGPFSTTADGPTTDNDGGALSDGLLYFNTTDNNMMVYKSTGSSWVVASSSGSISLISHKFTASGSETSVSASSFSPTLTYTVNNIIVFLNGVMLDPADYTATNGNDITGLSSLSASDELIVYAYKSFEVANVVSASAGGTFGSLVTFSGGLSAGDANITNVGNIALDTISSDAGTSIGVTLGTDAGDDFNVGSGKLLVEGDTGLVSIGTGGDFQTSTTGKIKQKGAFMQSSTHQSLFIGA